MEIKEQIAVMQAFAEGKEIESKYTAANDWKPNSAPSWNWRDFDYRIKPEPKLRPYTFEELQAEMVKGKIAVKQINLEGIVRVFTITQVMEDNNEFDKIQLSDFIQVSYERLLNDYTWLDGSPCGVIKP